MSQDLETLQKLVEKISKKFPQLFSPEFADHVDSIFKKAIKFNWKTRA